MDSTDADMMDSESPQPPPPTPPPSPPPSNSNQVDGVRGLLAFARHLIDQGEPSQALQAVVMAMRAEGGEEAVFQFLNRARASSAADELASLFAECAIAEALPSSTPDSIQPSISSGFQIANMSQVSSAGRPPLSSSSFKRKCSSMDDSHNKCANSSGRCHCSMKRKSRMKRVVRVPAISLKMSDIPPDDYSWRKYGQKPIKGSPHQRIYYKCSSLRGCPARKHVERALNDPNMLIVTYEGEHDHSHSVTDSPARPQLAIVVESS